MTNWIVHDHTLFEGTARIVSECEGRPKNSQKEGSHYSVWSLNLLISENESIFWSSGIAEDCLS